MPGIFDTLVDFGDSVTAKEEKKDEMTTAKEEALQTNEEGPQGEPKDIRKDFYGKDFYDYYKR